MFAEKTDYPLANDNCTPLARFNVWNIYKMYKHRIRGTDIVLIPFFTASVIFMMNTHIFNFDRLYPKLKNLVMYNRRNPSFILTVFFLTLLYCSSNKIEDL